MLYVGRHRAPRPAYGRPPVVVTAVGALLLIGGGSRLGVVDVTHPADATTTIALSQAAGGPRQVGSAARDAATSAGTSRSRNGGTAPTIETGSSRAVSQAAATGALAPAATIPAAPGTPPAPSTAAPSQAAPAPSQAAPSEPVGIGVLLADPALPVPTSDQAAEFFALFALQPGGGTGTTSPATSDPGDPAVTSAAASPVTVTTTPPAVTTPPVVTTPPAATGTATTGPTPPAGTTGNAPTGTPGDAAGTGSPSSLPTTNSTVGSTTDSTTTPPTPATATPLSGTSGP
jgi:hypothetical protein